MSGPCLCGALDCRSCGPLQGSVPCGVCGVLACDAHVEQVCSRCGAVDPRTVRVRGLRRSACCEARVELRQTGDGYEPDEPDSDAW